MKKRNELMHELLSLEWYENAEELFKESAETGAALLNETYESCTKFRKCFTQRGTFLYFQRKQWKAARVAAREVSRNQIYEL